MDSGKVANIHTRGDRSMKYTIACNAIVSPVFLLKLEMAKKIRPRSAKSRKILVTG